MDVILFLMEVYFEHVPDIHNFCTEECIILSKFKLVNLITKHTKIFLDI